MKVVKKGRKQKGWSKQLKCTGKGNGGGGCGATLLVEQADLFHTYDCDYRGDDEEWFVGFRCSECGVITDTEATPFRGPDLPHYLKWCRARGIKPKDR